MWNNNRRLSDHLASENFNHFTLIRLIAALVVVKEHSFSQLAPYSHSSVTSLLKIGLFGLPAFFFLSGLLVSGSIRRSASWKNFLWRRALRIYPAAWAVILSTAFLLGPVLTDLPVVAYFSNPAFYQYLSSLALFRIHFSLPGVFDHSVMGSPDLLSPLWSITLELRLYLALLILGWPNYPGKKLLWAAFVFLVAWIGLVVPEKVSALTQEYLHREIYIRQISVFTLYFLLGVGANIWQHKIVIRPFWGPVLLLLYLGFLYFPIMWPVQFLVVPGYVLWIATSPHPFFKTLTPRADISYGIYVFALPIQQLVANYFRPGNSWTLFLLSLVFVLPLALASWYGLEKKALGLKKLVR